MTQLRTRLMTSHTRFPLALVLTAVFVRPLFAADWPAYRHDFARSGVTQEKLVAPLHRQWTYLPAHKPMPAWPEPGRELNRLDFDYVFHVAVADGLVFFGSSADHKIYALDLATGRERWSFFTEAPVRFAPALESGLIRPIVDRILPLADAPEAHRVMKASQHFGKILLRVGR